MEKYNCTLGRYYNSEPVVNSRMEKIKKSKVLRSLRRGFCGAVDDEDACKFCTIWTVFNKVDGQIPYFLLFQCVHQIVTVNVTR